MIRLRDGRVSLVVASCGGFLCLNEEFHPPRRQALVASLVREQLEKAPRFSGADGSDRDDGLCHRTLSSLQGQPCLI